LKIPAHLALASALSVPLSALLAVRARETGIVTRIMIQVRIIAK